MKKYISIILIVAASLTGCLERDKGSLRIDSLSFYGNEFYCNQKIKMWMCIESDNLIIADYDWGSEAGYFTEKLFSEACWVTPNVPGEYDVWCKVTVGKNTETRHRKVKVSHYFFDYFKGSSAWTLGTGVERALRVDNNSNNYAELKMNSTVVPAGAVTCSFSDPNLKIPFSCRATIGHLSNMPTDSVTVGGYKASNSLGYTLMFDRDPGLSGLYISEVNFAWYPVGNTQMPLVPGGSGERYNGHFYFVQAGSGATQIPFSAYFYHPALNFAEKETKKVGLNISQDYKLSIYVAGSLVYETDELKKWCTANNYNGSLHVTSWNIAIPNANNGTAANAPLIYLTNTIADNTGVVYQGGPNELPNP
jgi:hypothetical protein